MVSYHNNITLNMFKIVQMFLKTVYYFKISIKISTLFSEYADFFNAELSENQVKITLIKQLTETIVNSSSVVPLALRAGIAGTSVIAEAVVNIAIICK